MKSTVIETPVGLVRLTADDKNLVAVQFQEQAEPTPEHEVSSPILQESIRQLRSYFKGALQNFNIPLAPAGTAFQQKVWKALQQIPYGSTTTYLTLSQKLGDTKAIRAVGRANGQNPIAIIIPCHRVIGSDNSLIGYAGGIECKRRLLQHEGALLL